jgi:hypothetical protein
MKDKIILPGQETNLIELPPSAAASETEEVLGMLFQVTNQLEQAVIGLMENVQRLNYAGDMNRLCLSALIGLLVEKGIFSSQEWESIYQTKVVDIIKATLAAAKKRQEDKVEEIKNEEVKEIEEPNTEPVLASEKSNVIHFPSIKKE